MKATENVVSSLNEILSIELTSINQYFLHAKMFKNFGFKELAERAWDKSIKDMKQADELMERILFLEGLPNMQNIGKLRIGQHPSEMLNNDYNFQLTNLGSLKTAIASCEQAKDFVSRDLLVDILDYEEGHIDWLETQQSLIESMGIENYLQSQMTDSE